MLCSFHRSLTITQAIGVPTPTKTDDFSITFG
jgi:hypothetical protein